MLSQRNVYTAPPDPYLKRSLQRRLHCEDPDQEKGSQKGKNAARIARKRRETARSFASARKARTLLHEEAELLHGVLGVNPHCRGKRRSRAPIRRARRGTGGAKRGRFSRRSEGGCPPLVVCAPVGAFALLFQGLASVYGWSRSRLKSELKCAVCRVVCFGAGGGKRASRRTQLHFFASANGK